MPRALGTLVLVAVAAVGAAQTNGSPTDAVEPLRLSTTIEGRRVVIELRDQSRSAAQEAIQEAFVVIAETLGSLDAGAPESDLARLNGNQGQGPQQIDQKLFAVLQKTLGFCLWSRGANGPLGGRLY